MRPSLPVVHSGLVIAVVISLAGVAAGNGSGEEIEFPYLLKIAPGNVLIVHGHDFRDEVWITWEPGDSLRVEGLPILPLPPVPRKVLSERGLAEVYGTVEHVRDLVDSGYTWRQATQAYLRERSDVRRSMVHLYEAVLDSTGSTDKAAGAVAEFSDRSLLEPGTKPVVTRTSIIVSWQGSVTEHIMLKPASGQERTEFPEVSEEDQAKIKTRDLAAWLDGRRTGTYVVLKSHRGTNVFAGDAARSAIDQIEKAKEGNIGEGPVDKRELERVIEMQGGGPR